MFFVFVILSPAGLGSISSKTEQLHGQQMGTKKLIQPFSSNILPTSLSTDMKTFQEYIIKREGHCIESIGSWFEKVRWGDECISIIAPTRAAVLQAHQS